MTSALERATRREYAKETFNNLKTHHYGWILDAAIKHFRDAVERTEEEILRLERFRPLAGISEHVQKERDLGKRRAEYRNILEALQAVRDAFTDAAAEEFAKSVIDGIRKESEP